MPFHRRADRLAAPGVPNRNVLSALPETMRVPSGLKATLTHPLTHALSLPSRWVDHAPHSKAAVSCPSLPETMLCAVGAECDAVTLAHAPSSADR